jgi:hypothetical protein
VVVNANATNISRRGYAGDKYIGLTAGKEVTSITERRSTLITIAMSRILITQILIVLVLKIFIVLII